jgi:hypothetical protein
MELEELYKEALKAKEQNSTVGVVLHLLKHCHRPSGFPRGELLSEERTGNVYGNVYAFNADKIIAWVKEQPGFYKQQPL